MNRPVVIVDGFSAANQYAPALKRRGYPCIHVQTTREVPPIYQRSFRPEDYDQNLVLEENVGPTIQLLKQLNVGWVIAGIESGVNAADMLSEALGVTTNGTALSLARRDKYQMALAVQSAGLRIIPQLASSNVEEILSWRTELQLSQVVLKPPMSAGTDHVFICESESEIRRAFSEIQGKKNLIGVVNQQVLAQKLLTGTEYVVNMVSCRGQRRVTDIWRYTKIKNAEGSFVYDRDDLMESRGKIPNALREYVEGVLNALQIQHGPSHAEIYMTSEGPVLMEIAARIDGICIGDQIEACNGVNPVELALDCYLEPEKFLQTVDQEYEIKQHACAVSLISKCQGYIQGFPGLAEIKALPAVTHIAMRVAVGEYLQPTIDMATLPAIIRLQHADREQIELAYRRIRELENNGLFALSQRKNSSVN